jgi:carbon storage regulator
MLVLTRRQSEAVVIGGRAEVRVTLVQIRGDKVRLGFEAPPAVPVHRLEIFNAIRRERGEAPVPALGRPDAVAGAVAALREMAAAAEQPPGSARDAALSQALPLAHAALAAWGAETETAV